MPLEACRSAVDVLTSNADHHHAFVIASALISFNCAHPIDQAVSSKLDSNETEKIVTSWKALVTALEGCSGHVKERRARKSLEDFYTTISSLLADYQKVIATVIIGSHSINDYILGKSLTCLTSENRKKTTIETSLGHVRIETAIHVFVNHCLTI